MANAAGAAPGGHRNGFWGLLSLPGVVWLLALFVVPFYAIAAVAFGRVDPILRTADPVWSPLSWDFAAMNKVFGRVFGGDLGGVMVRTLSYVAAALLLCCLIGYPVAYYVARYARRWRGLLLAALVLPFWISYLMRMLAWVNLLQVDGYFNQVLGWLHLGGSRNWLDGDSPTVVIGLVYGYIPFFILPLYAALERLDGRLIEAGRDLGASPRRVFQRVTLPLSIPGSDGGIGHHRAADVRRLLHQHVPLERLAANRDDRQPDRALPPWHQPAPDRRIAGADPLGDAAGVDDVLPRRHGARPAVGGHMRGKRPERHALGLATITWIYVLWSLLPVLVAMRISFNSGKSRSAFQSPSWRWYFTDPVQSVWHDDSLVRPLKNTLKLAALSMLITMPIGVAMAIGLQRWRGRASKASNALMLFPLVTPEIVMGVALFLVFTQVYRVCRGGSPRNCSGTSRSASRSSW